MKRGIFILKRASTRRFALAVVLLFTLGPFAVVPSRADDAATKAARELTQKIEPQLDRNQKISIEIDDLTTQMHVADLDATRQVVESDLRAHGFHIVTDSSFEIKIQITLSQDSNERLWVASFTSDGKQSAAMVPFDLIRPDLSPWVNGVHLDRELVFSQNSPMLDFGCNSSSDAKDCGEILILNEDKVVFMATELNFPLAKIPHEKKWPRDLRGRITRNGPIFDVNIGDVICQGDVNHLDAMKCKPAGIQQWNFSGPQGEQSSVLISSERNWFEWTGASGLNIPEAKRVSFYSVSGFQLNSQPAWIATGVDGKTRVFTGKNSDPLSSILGWGSELATVKSNCGSGWQILTTRTRDYTETDSITVYEWAGNEFRDESSPTDMNGTIVAMWSANDGGPARAVVRNLKTGNYEAYLLKVGCSQ